MTWLLLLSSDRSFFGFVITLALALNFHTALADDRGMAVLEKVVHAHADSDGVRIHYVTLGDATADPVIMIHGFPDYWFTWREQMAELSGEFRVIALDQRGYNRSDKPAGRENYSMDRLSADVAAVMEDLGLEKATICGHDWGGAVAWHFAMTRPHMTQRLIILNLPHPRGIQRELATNPEQQENSAYARRFQEEGAHLDLTAEGLASWVRSPEARKHYVQAFERSDFEAMLHYYKMNYPRPPYQMPAGEVTRVQCPVLMIHGLEDKALMAPALNNTWEWLAADLTLVTIPGAGHFVQQDAPDLVTRSLRMWLNR
jgi:pimeloyl-ACP methyl ester carboxylesterase